MADFNRSFKWSLVFLMNSLKKTVLGGDARYIRIGLVKSNWPCNARYEN